MSGSAILARANAPGEVAHKTSVRNAAQKLASMVKVRPGGCREGCRAGRGRPRAGLEGARRPCRLGMQVLPCLLGKVLTWTRCAALTL
jgi:hypothetical protein